MMANQTNNNTLNIDCPGAFQSTDIILRHTNVIHVWIILKATVHVHILAYLCSLPC